MPLIEKYSLVTSKTTNGYTVTDTLSSEPITDGCQKAQDDYAKIREESTATGKSHEPTLNIVWINVFAFVLLHIASLYSIYLMITSAKWQTNAFGVFMFVFSGIGINAGSHRLWAHRSYKATLPLRILLAIMFSSSYQKTIYEWARDHRVHHKYSETDADPHDSRRGFFFSHVGCYLTRKHPDVSKIGKTIDTSDLLADPVVRFQKRYYYLFVLTTCFFLPTFIPMYIWNESFINSFLIPTLFRLCYTYNQTWFVNSVAHKWGSKPYDANIQAHDNTFTIFSTFGEGFHNYHHTFPYDYAASEYGIKYNLTTAFINLMAFLGFAYNLKKASRKTIEARKLRTGENSLINNNRLSEAMTHN